MAWDVLIDGRKERKLCMTEIWRMLYRGYANPIQAAMLDYGYSGNECEIQRKLFCIVQEMPSEGEGFCPNITKLPTLPFRFAITFSCQSMSDKCGDNGTLT